MESKIQVQILMDELVYPANDNFEKIITLLVLMDIESLIYV